MNLSEPYSTSRRISPWLADYEDQHYVTQLITQNTCIWAWAIIIR